MDLAFIQQGQVGEDKVLYMNKPFDAQVFDSMEQQLMRASAT